MKITKMIAFALIALIAISEIQAKELNINKKKENMVKFISDAPVEDFEGVTDKIDGYMIIESFDKLVGSELYFEVDLNSVDTGIGLRNRHMRENYLHTDKYPTTHFTGKIVEATKESDSRAKVKVKGKMFIHGVTKEMEASGYLTTNHEGSWRVNARFDVALTDYKIEVPELMFVKIDENMDLILDFYMMEVE